MSDTIEQTFWKALADSPFVMVGLMESQEHSIPMTTQLDKEAEGAIWFFTSDDNRFAEGGDATIQFASKGHDVFACIAGELVEEVDAAVLDKLWNNQVAAWYEGGKDDPSLLLLRFDIDDAELWTSDPGIKGMFKMMTGMTIDPREAGDHATVSL